MTLSPPRLIIAFAGGYGGMGIGLFEFGNFLNANFPDLHKVFVRDNSGLKGGQFYFCGLKVSGDSETQYCDAETINFEENLEILKKIINQTNYEKVIFIGNSSGAYAAILYGLLLNVSEVMAFAPFTNISQEYSKDRDCFASEMMRTLHKSQPTHKYYDIRALEKKDRATKLVVVYGPQGGLVGLRDKAAAFYLKGFPNTFIDCVEDGDHSNCVKKYRDDGRLKKMIDDALIPSDLLEQQTKLKSRS